jgi:hypothetical protein
LKHILTSGFVGSASGLTSALVGAPLWAVLLVLVGVPLAVSLALLAYVHMNYREVYRLARLANSGSVKGHGGIEWTASSEPATPEPDAPKPRRWLRRKPPPDS